MTTQAPDESARARQQITEALGRGHDHIDHATARLIAATIHPGPETALEAFAATGRFDVVQLERELRQNRYPFPQELWRGALLGYLAWQRTKQPWMRGLSAGQRRRMRTEEGRAQGVQLPLFADGEQSPSNAQRPNK
jgi:hypothetical protein